MTDRELLGLAAKAVRIELFDGEHGDKLRVYYTSPLAGLLKNYIPWNPLTDDGDAFRLAVKLGIDTKYFLRWSDDAPVAQADNLELDAPLVEETTHDPYAATRRVIVRAAAEIGRSMT